MAAFRWIETIRQLVVSERARALTVLGSRAYVGIEGPSLVDMPRFSRIVMELAEREEWLEWAYVEPHIRRVVLHVKGPMPKPETLRAFVTLAESKLACSEPYDVRERERVLPDDRDLELELQIEVLADALSVALGSALRFVPFVPRRLGSNTYAVLFLISQSKRLRKPIEDKIGEERTEFVLHLARAFAQTVAQRPMSALVDLSAKTVTLRELRERRALWEKWAEELGAHEAFGPVREVPPPRPREMADGPIERHSDRALMIAMGSFAVSLMTTRSPGRALAAGFAALPRPAQLGRELYAAELGRVLARHGTLVLAPEALKRLDRIDCIVMPARLVSREQFLIGDVYALRGITREDAFARAKELFSPARPLRVQQQGEYSLGPAPLLLSPLDPVHEAAFNERVLRGALVLALSRKEQVVALVEVSISAQSGVAEILNVARRASLRVVLASDDVGATEGLHPDDVIPLTRGLTDGIRRLQIEGHGVMFVSRGPSPAYAAADVGVALFVRGEPTPWSAHLLCPDDTRAIETVVDACVTARKVSEQSVRVGFGATALGTLAAAGARTNAAPRVFFVLNAASLASMVNAVRSSTSVERFAGPPLDPTPWHALDATGVLAKLGVTHDGLPEPIEAGQRAKFFQGTALIDLGRAVRAELLSPLSPLLALGAGISAMVGSMADAGIVAGVGGINALIGGYQRYRTERAIDSLVQRAETRVHVRRDGKVLLANASSLRPGDIVLFSQGDFVPADCRILEAHSLEVDTSSLTGESLPVLKSAAPSFAETISDITSMLFAGATIAAGRATAVVVATGDDTVMRRGTMATPDEARGGVEARLRQLMRLTGPVAAGAGALLVTAGMLRGRRMDDLVSTGVGLAVAAVPEGLPILATAAQLSAAERLSRKGSLVKNPRAIEALGRVDVLCVDKTGTLTEGRIELARLADPQTIARAKDAPASLLNVLHAAAHSVARDRGVAVDPLDQAILVARSANTDDVAPFERLAERAFESGRGFEAVLGREPGRIVMFVKGSPELLMSRARAARVGERERPIAEVRGALLSQVQKLGEEGLRVIAVAERAVTEDELAKASPSDQLRNPQQLVVLGLLAFRDPVRDSAAQAVAGLTRAGVRVVMITGDHGSTAVSVAREVGFESPESLLTGTDVAHLDEVELERAARRTSIFARVTPAQKVRIVRALQRSGHVVGMAGDGANDAAAMRIADVGIAVGSHATEAARGSADIVLADARVDAIVAAVIEGRAMWTAVRDAVSILVGGNLGEIAFTVGVGGLTGGPPLHPRQLLLVNFLTDIAPSMAIALRPPKERELQRLEASGPEGALGEPLNREILSRAISTSLGAGTAWTAARLTGTRARARTVGLVGLVGTQLGQTLISGGGGRAVRYTSLGSLVALMAIIQTPGLSHIFGCTPLGPVGWTIGLGSATFYTLLSPGVDVLVDQVADLAQRLRKEPHEPPLVSVVPPAPNEPVLDFAHALRLLRN